MGSLHCMDCCPLLGLCVLTQLWARKMCLRRLDHMHAVVQGVRLALHECRDQFKGKRWDCTVPGAENAPDPESGFTRYTMGVFPGVSPGSREDAFLSAIVAAGVSHVVARGCRQGQFRGSCSWVVPDAMRLPPRARRGGSSDDVEYGYQFAKWFVNVGDGSRSRQRGESLAMNLHDNEAGRLAVYNLAHMDCKCHLLFGRCMLKICWQQLADFHQVGNLLKHKYDTSSAMRLVRHNSSSSVAGATRWSRWRLEPVNERLTAPTVSDLVHVSASPGYCERNDAGGINGTVRRRCNVTSEGKEACSVITCCDRGYDISQVTLETQCGCKEQLKENVKCKLCPWTVDQFACK
ncbi:protein Wnt-5a-like [Lethenteron reissneri]|uniref:protein Wnt-5a-like n=1 Tax=Lethenteron reissneri TaxID=7753 RepID=UPI002AB695C8|nr:protein Wnt-5a-like [Lethenteron reissneri]